MSATTTDPRPDGDGLAVLEELSAVADVVRMRPDLYLRYSRGPRSDAERGNSRDHEADVEMPGLSVTTLGPEPWWPRPAVDWVARRLCQYLHLAEAADDERYPWLLEARLVGRGPDHEPLVADVVPVARVGAAALEQARARYEQAFEPFEAGRDSTDEAGDSGGQNGGENGEGQGERQEEWQA